MALKAESSSPTAILPDGTARSSAATSSVLIARVNPKYAPSLAELQPTGISTT